MHQPDAVFPNNWFSTHTDEDRNTTSMFILYPMKNPSREHEKNRDIVKFLRERYPFGIDHKGGYNDARRALRSRALEGTGSLNFDSANRIIYCSLSERADETQAKSLETKINKYLGDAQGDKSRSYQCLFWNSYDRNKVPIYHTNVVQAILDKHVVMCLESIHDDAQRAKVEKSIIKGGREIIDISYDEVDNFCGNMIML